MTIASLSATLQDAITLAQAAEFIPGKPHPVTVWRWSHVGVRGCRLQTWTIGGRRFTTIAAIESFLQSLNAANGSTSASHPIPPTSEADCA